MNDPKQILGDLTSGKITIKELIKDARLIHVGAVGDGITDKELEAAKISPELLELIISTQCDKFSLGSVWVEYDRANGTLYPAQS